MGRWAAVWVLLAGCSAGDGKGEGSGNGDVDAADGDEDGDGFPDSEDCDDDDGSVNPGAEELCNGVDDDCDGEVDEGVDATAWYADADGDGHGDAEVFEEACEPPDGYVADGDDCDDAEPAAFPGAAEICDGVDNDCDGDIDDADADVDLGTVVDWFPDLDGDGFGAGTPVTQCSPPDAHVDNDDDCDDTDPEVSPDAIEVCNDVDDDCDERIDDDDSDLDLSTATIWYTDADSDGYGESGSEQIACGGVGSQTDVGGDCDDADADVNPGAYDVCGNAIDEDCSGRADESCPVISDDADAVLLGEFTGDDAGARISGGGDFNGDGTPDLVIGAPDGGASTTKGGRAYVVLGPLTAGTQSLGDATFIVEGDDDYDHAGCSVDLLNDIDGDGYDDLLVGAWGVDSGEVNGGATFIVHGPRTGAVSLDSADAVLLADEATAEFARNDAGVLGDLTGDGVMDLLVGAPRRDGAFVDAGAGFIFAGPLTGSIGAASAAVIIRGAYYRDYGGGALAVADLTGDGIDDVVMGLSGADAVWMFAGPVTVAEPVVSDGFATLTGRAGDYFGDRVLVGDYDGDGTLDVATGARYHDGGATNGGAVFGFLGPLSGETSWTDAEFAVRETGSTRYLGSAQAGADVADLDADGLDDLLLGSYFNPTTTSKAGAAAVFFGPLSGNVRFDAADRTLLGSRANDQMGLGGAFVDIDGDGTPDVVGGANKDDTAALDAGAVFVLFGSGL
jgi:hypothetical protein